MLYDSWEEWTRHEQWTHQQRIWRCSEHPQREYTELATYEDHVRTYHVASVHQLLSSELLNSQQSVSQVSDRPCPFCQRDFGQSIELQQHIAGHLESIALLSLPNLDKIDESSEVSQANSNSANRNYAESRASDFDTRELLIFSENDILEDPSEITKTDKELFRLKLKAESVSYESTNEVNIEARQAYSSELSGGWLSRLPDDLDEEKEIWSPGPKNQTTLVACVKQMQELVVAFIKIGHHMARQAAKHDITDLIAGMKSVSAALGRLNEIIGDFPYHANYSIISYSLSTITSSIHLTFRDIRQCLGSLDKATYTSPAAAQRAWESIERLYGVEGSGSLARRVELFRRLLQELTHTLTEG